MDYFDNQPQTPDQGIPNPAPVNEAPPQEPGCPHVHPYSGEAYASGYTQNAEPAPLDPGAGYAQGGSTPAQPEPQPQWEQPRRKASPYADSPYVMNPGSRQPNYQYQPQPQPPKNKPPKKRGGFGRKVLSAILVIALVAGGCLITANTVNTRWEQRNQQTIDQMNRRMDELQNQIAERENSGNSVPGSPVVTGEGLTPAQVYAQNVDSVVSISVTVQSSAYGQIMEGTSSGSGFILTPDGYVVTNFHVVEGATAISVITGDGTELEAAIVGYDATNDVAVLKVEAQNLPAVTLGSSTELIVGDMVVAIGNPLGELNATQTVGYICGKDREITTGGTIINMLQTDAAINPGNSGGPLFNMRGEVVGITTAKYSGTTTSGASIEGIGFAIPIDDVMGIIGDLQNYGYVTGAYLGITVQNITAEFSAAYGISGAYVLSVERGYSADRAGLQPKDIIIGLDDIQVDSITDLTRALRNYKAGDTAVLTVLRNGVRMELTVTLDEKPQAQNNPAAPIPEDGMPSEGDFEEWYEYFRRHFGE